jgi:PAS domain S-box-containing protein
MNPLFMTFFGYSKEDLLGKKITSIMPSFYDKVHDYYMKSFIENIYVNLRENGEIESEYLDSDQPNYFMHKNGYIFPMTYRVSLNIENMSFVTIFRGEATTKSYIYFIVNAEWEIQELSTGAITYFDLEVKSVHNKAMRLDKLLPEISSKNGEISFSTPSEVFHFRKEITQLKVGTIT